jgi:hypothetical protein
VLQTNEETVNVMEGEKTTEHFMGEAANGRLVADLD